VAELVSILIPAYNAERWIGETICSALDQTWPNKEIIIVNDGSNDGTLAAAKRYESKSVKVITQQNQGACAARNEALKSAQGDYIQWLDADDLLAPDKISKQLEGSEPGRNSRTLLTSAFGTFFFRHQKAKFQPNALWQDLSPVDWLLAKIGGDLWMNPTAWLVPRRLTELGGPWDERLASSGDDDGEYICRLVSVGEKVRFVPEAKCFYRIGNLSSLNWKSSQALRPLFLSLCLTIGHLRSVEDSMRTRNACVRYLQTWIIFFYPDAPDLVQEIDTLVSELGGKLLPPQIGWKYTPIRRVFGWKVAKGVMNNWRKSKLIAARNWDRMLHDRAKPLPRRNVQSPMAIV
jgi:glycosyltransferase involved in cell wall biosynthesis